MADQRQRRLVGAGGVLELCPCGLCNTLAVRAEAVVAAGSGRSAASVVLGLGPRSLHYVLAAQAVPSQLRLKRP